MDNSTVDYSALDHPDVLALLFHPRPEPTVSARPSAGSDPSLAAAEDVMIAVGENVAIGARFHMAEKTGGNILFFHGNGEIAADYDELGPVYNRMGINFLAADYRGYGRSTGKPTVTAMMRDCHVIFDFVRHWLSQNNFPGPIILMGRSLGSACALELAGAYRQVVGGLIVESGFAYASPLLKLLGIPLAALGFKENAGFRNIDKISNFDKPALIIHAEFDHIIPFSDGQSLYEACPAGDKTLLKIRGANHNDIFMRGLPDYLAAVKKLVDDVLLKIQ
jgi:fermentation-respiration switch protein FrsA (DUF1100 family)